jgi:hypothetical protein
LVIYSLIGLQAWGKKPVIKTKIKNGQYARPLHNAISPRNEGCAGLGGRKCLVVKSLQNLSNNNTFHYIHLVNAPAGGLAGAVRCCHRAKSFGSAVGVCRDL